MSDKKQKKSQKSAMKGNQILTNRGKPSDIQNTVLQIPPIWTNDQICLKLIKYLQDIGRHICLHQAGKHNPDDKYKNNKAEIENTRDYYELAEKFADELFGHKCETKRCIVFFFRTNKDEKATNFNLIQNYNIDYQEAQEALRKCTPLFSQKFFEDLTYILNFSGQITQLLEYFIKDNITPQSFSPIVQNCYISEMLNKMKLNKSKKAFDLKTRGDKERNFYQFVKSDVVLEQLEKFINDIYCIFKRENAQYCTQAFEKEDVGEIDNCQEYQDEQEFNMDENSPFLFHKLN